MSSLALLEDGGDNLVSLIEELQNIDIDSPMATLNETTMSDNNGGRIEL